MSGLQVTPAYPPEPKEPVDFFCWLYRRTSSGTPDLHHTAYCQVFLYSSLPIRTYSSRASTPYPPLDGHLYAMDLGCAHPSPLLPLTMLGGSPPSLFLEGIQAPVIGVVPTCYRQGEEREPFISLLKKNNRKCSVHTKVERINEYHQLGAHQWLTKQQGPGENPST